MTVGASTFEGIGSLLFLIFLVLVVGAIVASFVGGVKKAARGETRCENCGGNLVDSGFGKLPDVVGTCRHCGHRQSWVTTKGSNIPGE